MSDPFVDRVQLNDELTALLAGFGWSSDTDNDDYDLNELTHKLADWIEARVGIKYQEEELEDETIDRAVEGMQEQMTGIPDVGSHHDHYCPSCGQELMPHLGKEN